VAGGAPNRNLARDLAERYGGSLQAWRNRLTQAKRFICLDDGFDEDGNVVGVWTLTAEAARLVYGDDYGAALAVEDARDREYRGAAAFLRMREAPRTAAERARTLAEDRRRGPEEVERLKHKARLVMDSYGQDRS